MSYGTPLEILQRRMESVDVTLQYPLRDLGHTFITLTNYLTTGNHLRIYLTNLALMEANILNYMPANVPDCVYAKVPGDVNPISDSS